jgi:hypothetical protein
MENSPIRPLPLGLDTQMSASLLERDLDLPAQDEPTNDLQGIPRRIGADSGLLKSGLDGHRLVSGVSGYSTLILPESGPLSTRIGSVVLTPMN